MCNTAFAEFALISISTVAARVYLSHEVTVLHQQIVVLSITLLTYSPVLQERHTSLQQQEAKLSAEVKALNEEVASLKASLASAEQRATELEQQLASEAETGKAAKEAFEKQSQTLQVYRVVKQWMCSSYALALIDMTA